MRVCVNTDFWGFFCPFRLRGECWKTFQIKQLIYRPNFKDLIFTQFQPCSRFQCKRKAARSWSWSLTTPMTYMPCSSRWGEWGGGVGWGEGDLSFLSTCRLLLLWWPILLLGNNWWSGIWLEWSGILLQSLSRLSGNKLIYCTAILNRGWG